MGVQFPTVLLGGELTYVALGNLHSSRVPPEDGKGKVLLNIKILDSAAINWDQRVGT